MKTKMGPRLAHLIGGKHRAQAEGDEPEDEEDTAAAAEDDADPEDDEDDPEAADGEDDGDGEDDDEDADGGGEMSGGKKRIRAILNAPEAKGRSELAQHLALETNMSAKAARRVLAKSPQEKGSRLDQAMAAQKPASLGRGGGAGGGGADGLRAGLHAAVQRQISKIKPAA